MKRVKCVVPPFAEPTFDTPQEAIAHRAVRNDPLELETAHLKGLVIEEGYWTDTDFGIRLSNGELLRLSLDAGKVVWSVSKVGSRSLPETAEVTPLTLDFDSGENLWDRKGLLESRIGRRFRKVFAGEGCLWVYIEGQPILMFDRLINAANQMEFLYWADSD